MPIINIGELEIYYAEKGSGETLLLFPDNIHSSIAYDKEIDYFSKEFHGLSYYYPGIGRSCRGRKYQDEQEVDLWNY